MSFRIFEVFYVPIITLRVSIILFSQLSLTKTRGEPILLFHEIVHEKFQEKFPSIQFGFDFERDKNIDE